MNKTTTINDLTVNYKNQQGLDTLVTEIFEDCIYDFDTLAPSPLILDCGAHIGLSVLYFKARHPQAEIIAFEPNPVNFELLQQNIKINNLSKVTCLNAGVADFTGDAIMYGHFGAEDGTLGNSITPYWGQRHDSSSQSVQVIRLSDFIGQKPVEFLKLDVEGAEWSIIKDITLQLSLVKHLFVEFHTTLQNFKEMEAIKALLAGQHFIEKTISHQALSKVLTGTDSWTEQNEPIITQVIFKNET